MSHDLGKHMQTQPVLQAQYLLQPHPSPIRWLVPAQDGLIEVHAASSCSLAAAGVASPPAQADSPQIKQNRRGRPKSGQLGPSLSNPSHQWHHDPPSSLPEAFHLQLSRSLTGNFRSCNGITVQAELHLPPLPDTSGPCPRRPTPHTEPGELLLLMASLTRDVRCHSTGNAMAGPSGARHRPRACRRRGAGSQPYAGHRGDLGIPSLERRPGGRTAWRAMRKGKGRG